jgi:Domain of unknown function (DUF1707)/Cell wall-active antibiotics response 4TMS YvqF
MTEPALPPALLASDRQREQAIATLRDAVVEGRLTLDEYSDRVGIAVGARTTDDLAALTRDLPQGVAVTTTASVPAEHRAIFSHLVRRGPLRLSAQSSYRSVFGTIDLDLRQATLPGSEVDIAVHNIFGTVTVFVPEGVDVRIEGGGMFASQHVDTSNAPLAPGAPIIRIRASGPGGTLYVRTHELPGWVERQLTSSSS